MDEPASLIRAPFVPAAAGKRRFGTLGRRLAHRLIYPVAKLRGEPEFAGLRRRPQFARITAAPIRARFVPAAVPSGRIGTRGVRRARRIVNLDASIRRARRFASLPPRFGWGSNLDSLDSPRVRTRHGLGSPDRDMPSNTFTLSCRNSIARPVFRLAFSSRLESNLRVADSCLFCCVYRRGMLGRDRPARRGVILSTGSRARAKASRLNVFAAPARSLRGGVANRNREACPWLPRSRTRNPAAASH
jgi:hypothetical protein